MNENNELNQILSELKTCTDTDNIHEAIYNFLIEFEAEHDINIFYVCEINSRPNGVDVVDSDFDLVGFYLPNPNDSLKIIHKIPRQFKYPHRY
jgi:hypothetical protein